MRWLSLKNVPLLILAYLLFSSFYVVQPAAAWSANPPINLHTTEITDHSLSLMWDFTDASSVTGLELLRSTDGMHFEVIASPIPTATSYGDTGLLPGTNYQYKIRGVLHTGLGDEYTAFSSVLSVRTADSVVIPAAPSNLVAAWNGTNVLLTWNDNSDNEDQFIVEEVVYGGAWYVRGSVAGSSSSSVSLYVSGVEAGHNYSFRVRALKGSSGYSTYSNEASLPIPVSLLAPSTLTAAGAFTSVHLNWVDNSADEAEFYIYRKEGSEGWRMWQEMPANSVEFTDNGLTRGTTYSYQVTAVNPDGISEASNIVRYAVPAPGVIPPPTPAPASTSTVLLYYINADYYYNNGAMNPIDAAPITRESRTLLPIRFLADPLGATTAWDAAEGKVTITFASKTIELWINHPKAKINGSIAAIDPINDAVTPIVIPPGRTMVPLSFIARNLGCGVEWDADRQEVKITYPES
ncbi:MAG TPA: stalk domain-containing protein [Syntrophomonadaceae bacterium]|nr:stalk domain-containing protein [Syntrophomonadaceae bacterium]